MPELPDLQALSYHLSRRLIGKKVEKIHATQTRKIKTSPSAFQKALKGAKVTSVYRDGKEIHLAFDNNKRLGVHLMLRGQLVYHEEQAAQKFVLFQLKFSDGTLLSLNDFQKQATAALDPERRKAPDALSKEAGYAFLKSVLKGSKASVKKLLMDQAVIRGIGNAYADEILWHARISPFSICNQIPDEGVKTLARSIRSVLLNAEKTIRKNAPEFVTGENRAFLAIHHPERSVSPTGAPIKTDSSGSRKTYYTDEQILYK